ncbi:MAG: MBL fold metallo-hydrolase [Planctomycetes bacterium]|nr:MBL fold metallo-hydrolase [Planctomycetota bacterium]
MNITWWGTRGGIPTPEPDVMRYGGDTTCVEVRTSDDQILILDAGTGLRQLGQKLLREGGAGGEAHILLTHFHWDHIQGIPFFAPLYHPGWRFTVYGAFRGDQRLQAILQGQMGSVYFPVSFEQVQARVQTRELVEETFRLGETRVSTVALRHPQGSLGYRIADRGRVFAFATDVEQPPEEPDDPKLVRLARGADVFAMDAQYSPEGYRHHLGWGHSTWEVAARIARRARVGRLVLIHHDPYHDDARLDAILGEARGVFPRTDSAYRGMVLDLAPTRAGRKGRAALAASRGRSVAVGRQPRGRA